MAVKVGSARIDENGKAHGGKAGNQTGKELSTQNWYKHSKGWRVLRCIDADKAAKIAEAMLAACCNAKIGYDQYQRLTLYDQAKKVGFDPAKVTVACETDCSALVRVCLAYAGITVGNFRTTNQANMMLATGAFVELSGGKYTDRSDYLRKGDVLVTRTQGHTVVVLNDGGKAMLDDPVKEFALGDRLLKKGMAGADVKALQESLLKLGYALPKHGADGDYGSETVAAVTAFQKAEGLTEDGCYGDKTHAELMDALSDLEGGTDETPAQETPAAEPPAEEHPAPSTGKVQIVCSSGSVNIRVGNGTQFKRITSAKNGAAYEFIATASNGWHAIVVNGQVGWVSGQYSKIA